MPFTRYQIRNEYTLADPELYLIADKDDPEALLEGVAMAGLVGLLRQLGDLAEFAAEIFHDLHEEVMVISARGHGLLARVQQLEAEFPSLEKAFLSQTSHSSLYYNAGVDWHPNLRMNQNLVTQGDLPRFVMDSYEECRGPPRLFILDKFDVAGAGSCLKRYTNPSFFKMESALYGTPNVEIHREKKIRKVKKKGARGRTGETSEVSSSNLKLHQLFLEEQVENGSNDPAHIVKLKKRQLNGSLFDSHQIKKSYMQKILQSPSPEHKLIQEIPVSPLPSKLSSEIIEPRQRSLEIQLVKSALETFERTRSRSVSPIAPETESVDEKEMTVEKTSNGVEGSGSGSCFEDVGSEIDSFTDALNTLESEIETDTECRPKNDLDFFNDVIEEQHELQPLFSDSQSIGYCNASDNENLSFIKGTSSYSYSDLSCLEENTLSDGDLAAEVIGSRENYLVESLGDSSNMLLSASDGLLGTNSNGHSLLPIGGACDDVSNCSNSNSTPLLSLDPDATFLQSNELSAGLLNTDPITTQTFDITLSDSNSMMNLPSDSDLVLENASSENVVEESFQTKNSDDSNNESSIDRNEPTLVNVSSTENLTLSSSYVPDIENFNNIGSKNIAISVANSEKSAPLMDNNQRSSFSDTKFSEETDKFISHETDSRKKTDLEGVCMTKEIEEVDEYSSREDEKDIMAIDYPNRAIPVDHVHKANVETENILVEPEAVTAIAIVSVNDCRDVNHLSQDSSCSSLRKSMKMQESSFNLNDPHQNGSKAHQWSPQECVESEEQKEICQLANNSNSILNDIPPPSLSNFPTDDANSPSLKDNRQHTECSSKISGTFQIDQDQIDNLIASPTFSKQNEQKVDSGSPHQTHLSDHARITGSLKQTVSLQTEPFDVESVHTDKENAKLPILYPEKMPDCNYALQERYLSASTEFPREASTKEIPWKSAHVKPESSNEATVAPSKTFLPCISLLPQISQVNLEEMPPLPPLPPMQWRIGRSQQAALVSEQKSPLGSLMPIPSIAAENVQFGFLPSEREIKQTQISFLASLDDKDNNLAGLTQFPLEIPTIVDGSENQNSLLTSESISNSIDPFLPLKTMYETPQDSFIALEIEREQLTSENLVIPRSQQELECDLEDKKILETPQNFKEEKVNNSKEFASLLMPNNIQELEKDLEDKQILGTCQKSKEEKENNPVEYAPPLIVEDQQPQHGLQILEEVVCAPSSSSLGLLPVYENVNPKEDTLAKIPRPRNPLIDAVAAHDKSKLRRVIERARPQNEDRVEERDSLLQQIRTKSFNLKPAIVSRPSIEGPKTNLKVSAILEKANAIRQVLVGSDDDDDDNWSDD